MKPDFDDLVGDLMIEVRIAQGRQRLGVRKAQEALLTGIQELQAINADLLAALEELVVWADWHNRRHQTPSMGEPNTGAREKARAALAKAKGET